MFSPKKSPSSSKDGLGMEVLWPTCRGEEKNIVVDIVFVHGLRGSRYGTWMKDGILWPRDLLAEDHKRARILTWGYDADVIHFFGPVGTGNINDHSNKLLHDLSQSRFEEHETGRPLIFIAHSLGGLIVKDLRHHSLFYYIQVELLLIHVTLLKALFQSDYQGIQRDGDKTLAAIKKSTKGVLFASTPHRGADKAKWASIAGNLAKFMQKDHSGELVDSLKRGGEVLERLQNKFSYILRHFAVYTLLEELEYPKIGKIVEKDSAVFGDRDEKEFLIHGDHASMIKFSTREDGGYKSICYIIRVILRDCIGIREETRCVSSSVSSALPPPLRASSSHTSRRGSPLLIEGTPGSSSEPLKGHVSPLSSDHSRNMEQVGPGSGSIEYFQDFATDVPANIGEVSIYNFRVVKPLRQADQLFLRPHKERSTTDITMSQMYYMEALESLKKQPLRQHSDLHAYIYDKMAQISITMTHNKAFPKEQRIEFLFSAEYYALEARKWALSCQNPVDIAKTRLLELFVRARRIELEHILGTSGNRSLLQQKITQLIEDIAQALKELNISGSTNLQDFINEAHHWTEHLRRILEPQ